MDHNTATEAGSASGGIVNGGLAVIRDGSVDHNSANIGAGVANHGTTITGNTAPTDSVGTGGIRLDTAATAPGRPRSKDPGFAYSARLKAPRIGIRRARLRTERAGRLADP